MIILIGDVVIQPGRLEEALALSQKQMRRTRKEPGCIAHAVYLDPESPFRLVSVQRWTDQAALQVHLDLAESHHFALELTQLANAAPNMQIFTVTQT